MLSPALAGAYVKATAKLTEYSILGIPPTAATDTKFLEIMNCKVVSGGVRGSLLSSKRWEQNGLAIIPLEPFYDLFPPLNHSKLMQRLGSNDSMPREKSSWWEAGEPVTVLGEQ